MLATEKCGTEKCVIFLSHIFLFAKTAYATSLQSAPVSYDELVEGLSPCLQCLLMRSSLGGCGAT